jgi:uncharacterized protein (TIGR02284 family)
MQASTSTTNTTQLVAQLNDLLQLDRDAVQAYTMAIRELSNEAYRETLRSFRSDHERHIDELRGVIESLGGRVAKLPHASGVFKLGLQAMAGLGDDAQVLAAFRANEEQVRDKYQRMADMALPPEASAVVIAAASDEARHFQWADRTLRELGYTEGDFERAARRMHRRMADMLERGERATRTTLSMDNAAVIAGTALAVIGAGAMLTKMLRR